jgi:hypothetical protein
VVRSVLCSVIVLGCLSAGTASAASVRYEISGSTALFSERFEARMRADGSTEFVSTGRTTDGVTNVAVTGEAVLNFDGSRVTLEQFDVSFDGVAINGVIAVDAAIGVIGGAGGLIGNVLTFDVASLSRVSILACTSPVGAAFCDAVAPLGVREFGPFVLSDFVFDADGNFSTAQNIPGAIPIGVSGMPGLASMASATSDVGGGLILRATRVVPEPSTLGLLGAALALFTWVSTRRRTLPR